MSKSFTKKKRKLILYEKTKSEPTKKKKKDRKEEDEKIIDISELNLSKNLDNSFNERKRNKQLLSFKKYMN